MFNSLTDQELTNYKVDVTLHYSHAEIVAANSEPHARKIAERTAAHLRFDNNVSEELAANLADNLSISVARVERLTETEYRVAWKCKSYASTTVCAASEDDAIDRVGNIDARVLLCNANIEIARKPLHTNAWGDDDEFARFNVDCIVSVSR